MTPGSASFRLVTEIIETWPRGAFVTKLPVFIYVGLGRKLNTEVRQFSKFKIFDQIFEIN